MVHRRGSSLFGYCLLAMQRMMRRCYGVVCVLLAIHVVVVAEMLYCMVITQGGMCRPCARCSGHHIMWEVHDRAGRQIKKTPQT